MSTRNGGRVAPAETFGTQGLDVEKELLNCLYSRLCPILKRGSRLIARGLIYDHIAIMKPGR